MFISEADKPGGTILSDCIIIIVTIGVEVPDDAIEPMLGVDSLATVKWLNLSRKVNDTLEGELMTVERERRRIGHGFEPELSDVHFTRRRVIEIHVGGTLLPKYEVK